MPICSNWLHLTPNKFYAHTPLIGFTHRHVITPTRSRCFARAVTSESVMAAASNSVRVAAAQMTSVNDLAVNFATCSSLVKEAVSAGAKLLCLPEAFSYVGARDGDSVKIAEPLDGPIMQRYCSLARESSIWLSLGGFQEKGSDDEHLHNTHVVIDDIGNIRSTYRKIHLFDVDVPGGRVYKESSFTEAGKDIVAVDSPIGRLGLTVCYDLRFPEIYQQLRFQHDAQVLLVPSAFTKVTGEAHWEILLRARAIETQCYVIAAAQAGMNNDKREKTVAHRRSGLHDQPPIQPAGKPIATMLIPKADRKAIHEALFREGVLVAQKDYNLPEHPEIPVKNLYVIKAMQSLNSRGYVKTQFSWQYYYYTLTPEGLDYLREWLHLPAEIVPATHIKQQRSHAPPRGMLGEEERRRPFGRGRGDRGDREGGYRRRDAGEGKEGGAPGEFNPQFRGGFGRGRGAPPS